MDRLTELFAGKPTSYMGLGVVYNGDTRGNGVTSQEQDALVVPRFNQGDSGGGGNHAWKVRAISNSEIEIISGTLSDGITTYSLAGVSVSVTPDALNYVYLKCGVTPTYSHGFCTGGTVDSATVEADSSVPADTESEKHVLLLEWDNNARSAQHAFWSLGCKLGYGGEDVSAFHTWPAS